MPKRVIDFDAMWGSDKIASCAEWAQAEYAWLYGLADASGCFELTNLRVIWGRVAAIRRNLTIKRLEQIFDEFQVQGLLFVWEHEGKRYGHWTGSDVPGRLPAPSWRVRLERLAPPVPKRQLAEYVSRFARGRATIAGGGFRGEAEEQFGQGQFESSDLKFESRGKEQTRSSSGGARAARAEDDWRSVKARLEQTQAQDWNLNQNLDGKGKVCAPGDRAACGDAAGQRPENPQNLLLDLNSKAQFNSNACRGAADQQTRNPQDLFPDLNSVDETGANCTARAAAVGASPSWSVRWRDKSELLARELMVGRGPGCGPVKIKPEALERIRAREAARRAGSRSP